MCAHWCAAALVDEDGASRAAGLSLNSSVAVPALNIPASAVSMVVAGANGTARPEVSLQVSNLTEAVGVGASVHVHVHVVHVGRRELDSSEEWSGCKCGR